jgi:hypothetical protein
MFRLQSQIERERAYNRRLAWIGCNAGDWLRQGPTPEKLQGFQDAIRQEILAVEERIRRVGARKNRRAERLGRARTHPPEFHRKLDDYTTLAKNREYILQTRRAILRQCGDACAWSVLRTDPRLILPLFSGSRTHHLSSGIGLVGPIQIMSWAHDSGQFLVVENDLTRCMGIGDLTVVRADGRWMHPLPIEVKSKGEFAEGAFVEVDLITAYSNHPLDQGLFDAFSRLLDLKERENPRITPKIERQTREIQERSEIFLKVTGGNKDVMPFSDRSLWKAMENILAKAQYGGYSYDSVEDGIAFVAIRNREGDDAVTVMHRVLRLLDESGFGGDRSYTSFTSEDFRTTDWMAAIAPPIPLWPIQGNIRTDVLTGDLFFACVFDPAVWQRAFEAYGIAWREEEGRWIVSRNGDSGILDPIEVQKLRVGVAFAGVSPRAIAETIAKTL